MQRRRLIALSTGVAAAALVAAVAVGVAATAAGGDPTTASGAPSTAATSTPAPANGLSAGGLQDPSRSAEWTEDSGDAVPVRVRIPSIGVDSSLESLGIGADGALTPPVDYDDAGWFADGVVPGEIGPAIIAGHVDSPTGPAVFLQIGELAIGAEVLVDLSTGETLTFDVTGTQQSAKAEFPTSDVYSVVPRPELRLITCAGSFDSSIGHYTDNLIVYAALRG